MYFDNLKLSTTELAKLIDRFGEAGTHDRLENLSLQMHAHHYSYRSHYHAVLAWDRREIKRTGIAEAKAPPIERPASISGDNHTHHCIACHPPHFWSCGGIDNDGYPCGLSPSVACRTFIEAIRRREMARRAAL